MTVAVVLLARPDPGLLRAGSTSLLQPLPAPELSALTGQRVEGRSVLVQGVVSPTGFWVGSDEGDRMFLEVLGTPRFPIRVGEEVSFVGYLDVNHEGSAERFGLRGQDAALLHQRGHHIHVEAQDLRRG